MKFPWEKKPDIPAMSEAELAAGVARCDRMLARRNGFATAAANGSIMVTAGAQLALFFAAGCLITPFVAFGGLAIGVASFFGIGFTCKGLMTRAVQQRNELTDVLEERINTRLAQEQENERLRRLEAAEKFNAAVDAGLPLETNIVVKKSLRLQFPPDTRTGFARVVGKLFDPGF